MESNLTLNDLVNLLQEVQFKCMYNEDKELQSIGYNALKIRETIVPNGMSDFINLNIKLEHLGK